MLRVLCLLFVLVSVAVGHLCILNPPQRGGFDISQPGTDACYGPYAPCGKRNASAPSAVYTAGQPLSINFQQNYNHWFASNPGWLDAGISFDPSLNDSTFIPLGVRIPDFNANLMVWQTNFSITTNLPTSPTGQAVIRVRYVSNNPDEAVPGNPQAIFYSCADVMVKPAGDKPQAVLKPASHNHQQQPDQKQQSASSVPSCCVPSSFHLSAIEANPNGQIIHSVYFDQAAKMIRWDRTGNVVDAQMHDLFVCVNYSSMSGWAELDWNCEQLGPDRLQPWCYGPSYGQSYLDTVVVGGTNVTRWQNSLNQFSWWTTEVDSTQNTCAPLAIDYLGDLTLFYNLQVGPIDPSVWTIPASQCQSNSIHAQQMQKRESASSSFFAESVKQSKLSRVIANILGL